MLAAAVLATAAALATTSSGSQPDFTRLLLTATLGLPLFFALSVFAELHPRGSPARWFASAAGLLPLAAFWLLWTGWSSPAQTLRYIQLSLAFHLFAAFAPYVGSVRPNGFWQYNRILFLRFLTASLYTLVLYAGLAVALLAIEKLFGVHLPYRSYENLWIVIAFLFNTWFFLGGIPENLQDLDERTDYPAGLRVFAQYVLVPIVALYLTILTLYLAKVLVTRAWPNGWIGYLVSGVAVAGLLAWLLVYPLEERDEHRWVKTFTRGFYIALMPAIVMLWFAIYRRVSEYGITEPRYFLIILSIWLAGIAVWFTLTRSRNIKLIPASLCVLALVTFAGPTGAYAVSRASQSKRLETILVRDGLLANGRIAGGAHNASLRDRREIGGIVRYLLRSHGANSIGAWLPDSVRKELGRAPMTYEYEAGEGAKRVMAALDVPSGPAGDDPNGYFSFSTPSPRDALPIEGYNYVLRLSYWNTHDSLQVGDGYTLKFSADSTALQLSRGDTVALTIPLSGLADSAAAFRRAHGNTVVPAATLSTTANAGSISAMAYLTLLAGYEGLNGPRMTSIAGDVFLHLNK